MCSVKKYSLIILLLLAIFQTPPALAAAPPTKKSYIVYLGGHAYVSQITEADLQSVSNSHHSFLGSFLGSTEKAKDSIIHSYTRHINGFAALLDEQQANEIAKHPDVVSVFLDRPKKLHTTHSWEFMRLEKDGVIHKDSVWNKANFGEDIIIATLDTGVWPESQSFDDVGYGPIPSRWKGECQDDTSGFGVRCNRKLIGARFYSQGYVAAAGPLDPLIVSARDHEGHGSHTLSTAGGNFVPGASVFGAANGTAKGGSPRARVAAYKVCWPQVADGGCFDSDILKAFDAAISDGVDVISVSLGGTSASSYMEDGIAIGAFHAIRNGVSVVCSAGNSGPSHQTVVNVAPWIITVGASTLDREFINYVWLRNGKKLKGTVLSNLTLPENKFYPLITGKQAKKTSANDTDAELCKEGSLDPHKVKGKILACLRGENARIDKGYQAYVDGAAGMILCNSETDGDEILADPHFLPASHLTYKDGLSVFDYIKSTKNPLASISAGVSKFDVKPSPVVAGFSSRGPSPVVPEINKPDITAPGVDIMAAYSLVASPTNYEHDDRKFPYIFMSGTSMACPHVSGTVGLLKSAHPDWSPAAIHSALMTTARTRDNTRNPMRDEEDVDHKGDVFSHGSGHVRPNRAVDPGLVYDISTNDYLDLLCGLGYNETIVKLFSGSSSVSCPESFNLLDFNYPSISVPKLYEKVTLTRKLKNVGSPGTYEVHIREPYGIKVSVEPAKLKFDKVGDEKVFQVTLESKWSGAAEKYGIGGLTWTDGQHYVRSPITISAPTGGH